MKHLLLIACLSFPLPAVAQDDAAPQGGEIDEGFSLLDEGARLLFRGLMGEMEPAIDEFEGLAREMEPALELFATEFGPALLEIVRSLDSLRYYGAPEILPNGDIIIRREPDAPVYVPEIPEEGIDL